MRGTSSGRLFVAGDSASVVLLAPVIVLAHIVEEAPGLVAWYNRYVTGGLSQESFVAFNVFGLLVTILLAAWTRTQRTQSAALVTLAWLSFVMLANGIAHLAASLLQGQYVPASSSWAGACSGDPRLAGAGNSRNNGRTCLE